MARKSIVFYLSIFLLLLLISFSPYCLAITEEINKNTYYNLDQTQLGFFAQVDNIFWNDKDKQFPQQHSLTEGINIPRARFYIKGKKLFWTYHFAFDAAEVLIREAYLRYEKYRYFRITLGQNRVPYSFTFLTSQSKFTFLEQALPVVAFNPGWRVNLQLQYFLEPFTYTLGLVGPEIVNRIQGNPVKGHIPLAENTRITFAPIHTAKQTLHLGAASIWQEADSLESFRFRTFPEIQTRPNHFLVDTHFIPNCKNYIGQQIEFATILGSFSLVSEYYQDGVSRYPENLLFKGFFIMADYFLTGENYIYSFKEGAIENVSKIRHSYGAWQLAVRYSVIDLIDKTVQGGMEHNITLGVNWIANDYLKLMLNYIYINANPASNGSVHCTNVIAVRCQLSASSG